ncbi:MAG: 2-oxoglutarate dehydrogenase E1 component, partial [Verrucomicrobiota bacterium]|nr:2-oxoglutarate dehydrogenase E1 component [Verrucomicrobiota bacterium]
MSADLLEANYERWLDDPTRLEPTWSAFFEGFALGTAQLREMGEVEGNGTGYPPEVVSAPGSPAAELTAEQLAFRGGVVSLVYNYRTLGHTQARINPLDKSPPRNPRLELLKSSLNDGDFEREASTQFFRNGEKMQLREMVEALDETYSGWIGFEFMHIHNTEVRNWIRERIEERVMHGEAPQELQEKTLGWLLEAELFESFVGKKFLGEKRFSLEGGEGVMAILNQIIELSPGAGVKEVTMGMAHRGRLNVLAQIVRKSL